MRFTDIFPSVPPVKRLVTLMPVPENNTIDRWIWLRSLQGLINRVEPHLYLIEEKPGTPRREWGAYCEGHWLDWYQQAFQVPVTCLDTIDTYLDTYKSHATGYVLYDTEQVIQTQNLAITL